jgi:hypothetical protein
MTGKALRMGTKIRIGALVSGGGSNLQAIIDSCENGKINAEFAFVGSDNAGAVGLKRAANHKIRRLSLTMLRLSADSKRVHREYTRHLILTMKIFLPNKPFSGGRMILIKLNSFFSPGQLPKAGC